MEIRGLRGVAFCPRFRPSPGARQVRETFTSKSRPRIGGILQRRAKIAQHSWGRTAVTNRDARVDSCFPSCGHELRASRVARMHGDIKSRIIPASPSPTHPGTAGQGRAAATRWPLFCAAKQAASQPKGLPSHSVGFEMRSMSTNTTV